MKIKIHDLILNLKNEPFKLPGGSDYTYLELFDVVINRPLNREEVRTAEDKSKAFQLSQKLYGAKDELDLTVSEAAYILDRVDKMEAISPLEYGRAHEILDPKTE